MLVVFAKLATKNRRIEIHFKSLGLCFEHFRLLPAINTFIYYHFFSAILNKSPKTPRAVTSAPAPAP